MEPASPELPLLLVTVGLPRSGKTTWAQSTGRPIVCPDAIRLALHGQRFIPEAEPHVWATAQTMVPALFLAGHRTVVVDACNITRERRKMWLSRKWRTHFRVFDTTKEECIQRAHATERQDILPVIERMAAQWEPLSADETLGSYI